MTAIRTVELCKKYKDVTAVDGISFEIEEGELISLLGVNGAGKTTTIKMLSTLSEPTSGEAYVFGNPISGDKSRIKELIDVSMQETAVARKLTVEENIVFYAKLSGQNKDEVDSSKQFVYKTFGLDKVKDRQAAKLSGGWQRKLSIALALVTKPKVLFLDEPTLGLDVIARRELWDTIKALKGQMTIILTTHYMEEAQALSDKIGVMVDGKLLFFGTKEQMFDLTDGKTVEDAFIKIVSGVKSHA